MINNPSHSCLSGTKGHRGDTPDRLLSGTLASFKWFSYFAKQSYASNMHTISFSPISNSSLPAFAFRRWQTTPGCPSASQTQWSGPPTDVPQSSDAPHDLLVYYPTIAIWPGPTATSSDSRPFVTCAPGFRCVGIDNGCGICSVLSTNWLSCRNAEVRL